MNNNKIIYLFIYLFLNFYCYSVTVVCLFSPPQRNPPPSPTSTLPLDFVHVSFIVVPVIPSPHSPLAIARLFLTSMSLVIFCFLFSSADYVHLSTSWIYHLVDCLTNSKTELALRWSFWKTSDHYRQVACLSILSHK